ncbi:hypothetical protein AMR72_01910 [Flavobacterium psychrophilum]|nr:hypothetical protein AMR72_01910 [Flavobacterium psychrophilum]AOE51387.1 hypothetical protein ALW18_01910 [Flavobacterium psychrophilum]
MRILSFIIFLLLSACTLNAQAYSDMINLSYGEHKQQTLDLFLPKKFNKQTPLIIMLHGGAWVMGGKEYTDKTSKNLRNRGFIVANVDYRYVDADTHAKDLLNDIDNAITYLQKTGVEKGFSTKNLHLAGISAGAHLALLYGYTTQKNIYSISVLCPPVRLDNTEELKRLATIGLLQNVEYLANSKFENQADKRFTDVSPYSHIKNIPTLLIHGNKDDLVPHEHSVFLYNRLQEKKVKTKLVTMEGKGHDAGMNQPDSEEKVLKEITNWIKTNL